MKRLLVVLSAALALAACGGSSESPASSEGQQTNDLGISCESGSISASGSSAQANAIAEWVIAYQTACPDATIDYSPTGSGAGIEAFISGQTAFGGSDKPASDEELAQAPCEAVNIPLVGGEVVVVYNLDADVALSKEQVQGIFSSEITNWNEIDGSLPDASIVQFHRSDSSGTTANFAEWLGWDGGKEWTYPGGQGSKGSEGVLASVVNTPNSIGYVDLSYFYDSGVNRAELPENIDYYTYELICTSGNDALTKSFLAFAASEEGQSLLDGAGYKALPADMIEPVRETIAAM